MVDGEAARNGNDVTALFEGDDGTHLWLQLDALVWKSGERTGNDGLPPCLRDPGARAAVEVGIIEVARPYGSGSYQQALSLTCKQG